MAATYTYPGVYIEEVASGVRTIANVSTSNTAFVDYFTRGPVNVATEITSYADFERIFGGLNSLSEASYAISQYYLNGGQIAWVVRVTAGTTLTPTFDLVDGANPTLTVDAASVGEWGKALAVGVDTKTTDPTTLFNLVVREVVNKRLVNVQVFRNLSMDQASPRYAVNVVNGDPTALIRLTDKAAVGTNGPMPAVTGANEAVALATANPADTSLTTRLAAAFKALTAGSNADGDVPGSTNWNTMTGENALLGTPAARTGLYALDAIAPSIFNILCIPAAANLSTAADLYQKAEAYCIDKRAFLLVDIPITINTPDTMISTWLAANSNLSNHAAVYFPRLNIVDPLNENRLRSVGASGTIAGIYARTDATRGVWKAPAGTEAILRGAALATTSHGTPIALTDLENGTLNPLGLNAIRNFPIFGTIVWGARTLDGADQKGSEYKYIPVRRMALFLEESLYEGTKWVVFEPNDEPLWAQIRLNIGAFMQNLFRQGAFQGKTPREAYLVKCDKDTTTQTDINMGVVNIIVGFAPLKPAEFVVIKIQQLAGQITT